MPSIVSPSYLRRGQGVEFEMEAAWVRKHLPSSDCVIADVGCGNGGLISWLGVANGIGFDLSCDGLVYARENKFGARVACAGADRLPLPNHSVDVVVAQHVIEHLPNTDAAIREWRRILRIGGILLILTPNAAFSDPSVFDDPTHLQLFSANALRNAVSRTGLFVDEIRTLGLPWFRDYKKYPGGWRLRKWVTGFADALSVTPLGRERGQTLCCAATRGDKS